MDDQSDKSHKLGEAKICAKCGDSYHGFGNTCASCRKIPTLSKVAPVQCEACQSWFIGSDTLCEDCHDKTRRASEDPAFAVKFFRQSVGKVPAANLLLGLSEEDLGHRDDIVSAGGIRPLVRVLVGNNSAEKGPSAKLLNRLAAASKEYRKVIGEAATIQDFLRVLRSEDSLDVKETAARALKVAAVEPQNKQAIVDADGHIQLAELLRKWHGDAQAVIVWTLNNIVIGSVDRKLAVAKAGVMLTLVRVLNTGTIDGRIGSAATLQNLAVVPVLRDHIVAAGAVPPLADLLHESSEQGHMKACDALRNISLGSEARAAEVAKPETIQLIVSLLDRGRKEVKKSARDLLRDLAASSPSRLQAITAAGGTRAL